MVKYINYKASTFAGLLVGLVLGVTYFLLFSFIFDTNSVLIPFNFFIFLAAIFFFIYFHKKGHNYPSFLIYWFITYVLIDLFSYSAFTYRISIHPGFNDLDFFSTIFRVFSSSITTLIFTGYFLTVIIEVLIYSMVIYFPVNFLLTRITTRLKSK